MPVGHCDFSPDGERIVFKTDENLYVTDLTATKIRPLLDGLAGWDQLGRPRWSPDGRLIAYSLMRGISLEPNSNTELVCAVFVVDPDGGAPRQIGPDVTEHYIFAVFWTPEGHVTYHTNEGIRTLSLDGSEVRFIARKDVPYVGREMWGRGYSPNGRWFVSNWMKKNRSGSDLCILPAEGGEARRFTDLPGSSKAPTWSPDGRTVYFVSGKTDSLNIWKIRMDQEGGVATGEPQQITFSKIPLSCIPRRLATAVESVLECTG